MSELTKKRGTVPSRMEGQFIDCLLNECREGDIVRIGGRLWEVVSAFGYFMSARNLTTGLIEGFGVASAGAVQKLNGSHSSS